MTRQTILATVSWIIAISRFLDLVLYFLQDKRIRCENDEWENKQNNADRPGVCRRHFPTMMLCTFYHVPERFILFLNRAAILRIEPQIDTYTFCLRWFPPRVETMSESHTKAPQLLNLSCSIPIHCSFTLPQYYTLQ